MLFNSLGFILVFLPVVLAGFYCLGRLGTIAAMVWLSAASLFFYAYWDVRYLPLLVGSVLVNYGASALMARSRFPGSSMGVLSCAIAANLVMLGYFKYSHFFMETIHQETGWNLSMAMMVLPLGISFFTFTQIAFLVDSYQGKANERSLLRYLLFVTYFPHLIAGPILHHREMMPQFADADASRFKSSNFALGLSLFVIGLAKKLVLADSLSTLATPVFAAAAAGAHLQFLEAWIGVLAYSLQIYFDFSGYSEMAMGISLLFNVRLPFNFRSPYQAASIIDFWKTWHMTLSRFLREYLYIPLGGNRRGSMRRYLNLMITMLLGGLWHGAGWTFLLWGALHGTYLVINHAWRAMRQRWFQPGERWSTRIASQGLTFLAVVVAWTLFRSDNVSSACNLLKGMAGMHGICAPRWLSEPLLVLPLRSGLVSIGDIMPVTSIRGEVALEEVLAGLAVVWFLPGIRQIFRRQPISCDDGLREDPTAVAVTGLRRSTLWSALSWQESGLTGALMGAAFFLLIMLLVTALKSEFLYFQF